MTKVACVFGGESPEFEVSIVSAENVTKQLIKAGFEVLPIGIDPAGKWHFGDSAFSRLQSYNGNGAVKHKHHSRFQLGRLDFDVLFPIIHGRTGEDGSIQGFCELLGIPYVGGGVLNQSICMDKITTKHLLSQNGFPQPLWRGLTLPETAAEREKMIRSLEADFGYPVFIKPSRAGSSIGITKAKNRMDLIGGLELAFNVDSRVIVEMAVPDPVEIEIAGLGGTKPFLSVPGEVLPNREYYDFREKYLDGSTGFVVPAQISASMEKEMLDQAEKAWKLLDCHGLARIDFLCSGQTVFLSEINTVPGFTEISMYPSLLEKSGISQTEMMKQLVDLALKRHAESERNYRYDSESSWYKK